MHYLVVLNVAICLKDHQVDLPVQALIDGEGASYDYVHGLCELAGRLIGQIPEDVYALALEVQL
jgi:hypothetical protein